MHSQAKRPTLASRPHLASLWSLPCSSVVSSWSLVSVVCQVLRLHLRSGLKQNFLRTGSLPGPFLARQPPLHVHLQGPPCLPALFMKNTASVGLRCHYRVGELIEDVLTEEELGKVGWSRSFPLGLLCVLKSFSSSPQLSRTTLTSWSSTNAC